MRVRGELHFLLNGSQRIVTLDSPKFTIGRGDESSLCLQDIVVSRNHAEIVRLGNDFLLRDHGSTNGSYINDTRVSERILVDGDVVRFGKGGPELTFHWYEESLPATLSRDTRQGTTENLVDSLVGKLTSEKVDPAEEATLRCVLAETYLRKGDHNHALNVLAKYSDDSLLATLPGSVRATVLLWTGTARLEGKQYGPASSDLQRAFDLATQVGDPQGVAMAQIGLGEAKIGNGDLLAARDHLQRAMLVARRSDNARIRASVHLLLGKIDWKEIDIDGARYNWQRAARFAEGSNDERLDASVKIQQAFMLYAEGRLAEAVPAYQDAIKTIEEVGNTRLLLKAYSQLSRTLTRLGSWAEAEQLIERRLRTARNQKIPKQEAVSLTDLAEIRLAQGNVDAAWDAIRSALAGHGHTVYARTQRIYGRILSQRGELAQAAIELEKGLAAGRVRGSVEEQVLMGLDLATLFVDLGQLDVARGRLEEAESITPLDPALVLMGRAFFTRGRLTMAQGAFADANRFFTQSLSISETIGDPYRVALSHAWIGQLRLQMGRLGSARGHLEAARAGFARLGAGIDLASVEKALLTESFANVRSEMTQVFDQGGLTLGARFSTARLSSGSREIDGERSGPQRILVALASDPVTQVLTRGLEVENYVVDWVQDGRAALDRAREGKKYACLVLDALLEYRSGFDICREIRKLNLDTPVVLLGGRAGVEDKIEALQSGADDYLSKRTMVFEELLAKMEALLR
ncbi:MAG: tetratricopeptide repeat protein [Acidobacteria bacterium]|nr:tetratricopeptide repeat protein [Acidobacteriota bacterium]